MQQPNWFDKKFAALMGAPMGAVGAAQDAPQVLQLIATDPQIITAINDALASHDASSRQPGWAGPSRTQTIRKALAEVLQSA